ncbi:hypothetical protein C8R48DRAFT_778426 [Suillus tomentosus]|nr:hypothetical protein C8R48DRAFT_778426 [Suillus tomentosus]
MSFVGCLPVSVLESLFSEVLTASYEGRSLTTDVEFVTGLLRGAPSVRKTRLLFTILVLSLCLAFETLRAYFHGDDVNHVEAAHGAYLRSSH